MPSRGVQGSGLNHVTAPETVTHHQGRQYASNTTRNQQHCPVLDAELHVRRFAQQSSKPVWQSPCISHTDMTQGSAKGG
jgi:uncharacterized protein YfaT (DUF1175 family)